MKYTYDHIIKILKQRFGWTKIPLYQSKDKENV